MIWRVQLFGGPALVRGTRCITRFESSRVVALLARLALFSNHPASREELIELLWPEEDPDLGRQRFRQALYSLRRQLEPTGIPSGTILIADRQTVQLNPQSFTCDVVDFVRLVRAKRFQEARALYTGELLPGFYDDWILTERNLLQDLFEQLPDDPPVTSVPAEVPVVSPRPFVSLPTYLSAYFGREEEKRLLINHLASRRLITITGTGGIGKTRLSIEAAREVAGNYDCTAFVPLEECLTPDRIFEYIPTALHLPPSQSPPMDQMLHALAGRKVLLLLDNFEHLAGPEGATCVEEMLSRFPDVTCVVSSRRLLGLSGESEIPLYPLQTVSQKAALEDVARTPGIALFLDRAQTARPGFQITEHNREEITALCNALEGHPLALEIAASRIRAVTPAEMLRQLNDRFRLLARPDRGTQKDQRHRSILATLDWSWRLLSPAQQRFLSSLSIFRGGWTADLAAQVCGVSDAEERLEDLMMDSLVIGEETRMQTTRFRLLDMVRAFARDRLDPQATGDLILRHQTAFLDLAEQVRGGDQSLLFVEGENLKAALETAIESGDADTAFALIVAVNESWLPLVGPERASELFQQALHLPGGNNTSLRVEALALASRLSLLTQNRTNALALAQEALELAGEDPAMRSMALVAYARAQMAQTKEATLLARALLEEALPLAQQAGAERTQGGAYRLLGLVATRLKEYSLAESNVKKALARFDAVGDRQEAIYTSDNLAGMAVEQGNLDRALALYKENLRRAEEINDLVYAAKVHQNLATVLARQKRWEESLISGQECIRRNQALGNAFILAYALWNITEPLTYLGLHEDAARLMGFIMRFWVEQYDPLNEDEVGYCAMIRAHVAEALGESQTADLWSAGAGMTLDQAILLALRALPTRSERITL